MKLTVKKLTPEYEAAYDTFVRTTEGALFFTSLGYRNLLKEFFGNTAEDHYFLAVDENNSIKGAFPSFVSTLEGSGPIVNSLPFYGSNGGVITGPEYRHTIALLLNHFHKFTVNLGCYSSTVITSPFEEQLDIYEEALQPTFRDSRIGQFTVLPIDSGDPSAAVMDSLHYKTRNMVRKATKQGIQVSEDLWMGGLDFLSGTHAENMSVIGGKAKPVRFFQAIEHAFTYGKDYKLFTAWQDGKPVAALLLFYFNGFVEYFTPVIVAQHRSCQPMSLLIFSAMKDAVANGYSCWNWGGTWHSQRGVYQFKRSWGAIDKPYHYYIKIGHESVLWQNKEVLLKNAPFFYVVPFHKIEHS